ncbi:MAG: OB-fold domain-containing protein [Dehalococcoidia bacterium]|nr:OB-fold domain-containing protein [Dehalococcoidia bacterium]
MTSPARPLPTPTPETREYWDGLKRHELRIQRCRACRRAYFYPRPFCPYPGCHSQDVEWFTASGRGSLASYVIVHRGHPAFATPYVIAVVEMTEGGRMMTNLAGIDDPTPEALPVGAEVQIDFEDVNDALTLPSWRLVKSGV